MAFTGFARTAPGFFHELALEMNRDWYLENKARYEREWVAPMQALLEHVHAKLMPIYKPLTLNEPKIQRIHRDVRFAKDKTPYKTHIGAAVSLNRRKMGEGQTAMYLHFGIEEEYVGGGTYFFDPPRLAKWRKAVAGSSGIELMSVIAKLRKAGYEVGGHSAYKKVPKPYTADHPRAELLKMRGLTAGAGELPRGLLHQAKLADWLVGHGKAIAPLVKWLAHHVR